MSNLIAIETADETIVVDIGEKKEGASYEPATKGAVESAIADLHKPYPGDDVPPTLDASAPAEFVLTHEEQAVWDQAALKYAIWHQSANPHDTDLEARISRAIEFADAFIRARRERHPFDPETFEPESVLP